MDGIMNEGGLLHMGRVYTQGGTIHGKGHTRRRTTDQSGLFRLSISLLKTCTKMNWAALLTSPKEKRI